MKWIPNNLKSRYPGECVLITGASDGIGLAMSKHLSKKFGFNIIMASRSTDRLEKAKAEVLKENKAADEMASSYWLRQKNE